MSDTPQDEVQPKPYMETNPSTFMEAYQALKTNDYTPTLQEVLDYMECAPTGKYPVPTQEEIAGFHTHTQERAAQMLPPPPDGYVEDMAGHGVWGFGDAGETWPLPDHAHPDYVVKPGESDAASMFRTACAIVAVLVMIVVVLFLHGCGPRGVWTVDCPSLGIKDAPGLYGPSTAEQTYTLQDGRDVPVVLFVAKGLHP